MKKIFRYANIVDVENRQIMAEKVLVVEDGVIIKITDAYEEDGAEVIDLQGKYVMPGLFNCHTHMTMPFYNSSAKDYNTTWRTLIALDNLATYIKSGVTFVRDVGDFDFITVDIREAIKEGLVKMAPDIQTSGRPICMTGGSTWINGMGYQADGAEECRKAARVILRAKADWVKIMATGGTSTLGNKCAAPQLDEEEIRAAVLEAHKAGKKAVCHAQGIEGAKNAIRAGVDCLEHGFELDDEAIQMMVEKDIWLVPTLSASYEIKQRADEHTNKEFIQKAETNVNNVFSTFPKAYKAGVKCAAGTDCGSVLNPHTNSCEELILMVEKIGLTNYDALEIGTLNCAKLCGVEKMMGSIAVGKQADFAIFPENPAEKITALRHCQMTVKNGAILWRAQEF